MNVTAAFLPIILTMLCGYGLALRGVIDKAGWTAIETLSFKLLIPVVLIRSISQSDLAAAAFAGVISATVLTLGLCAMAVFVFRALRGQGRLPDQDFTTLMQTTTRWNAFIALAAAELLSGPEALILIAAAMAVLIPLINIFNIVVLARYGTVSLTPQAVVLQIAKNPLVQGCAIGLVINLSGLDLPPVASQTLDLIGRAALGIGLLTVGAALSIKRLLHITPTIATGIAFRLILCPLVFLLLSKSFGLSPLETLAGLMVLTVPAASNGYIVAKQMGGNADLYADILSWQTILSMGILPLYISVLPLI